jgi:hypothetical protein
MVNYSLGKVYKIEPMNGGEEGDIYIGSTALPMLCTRMGNHRNDYKRWKENKRGLTTVYKLFDKYGVENCHIVLLESISAETKDGLFACERKWIQSQKCVNKFVSGRKPCEYRQDNKDAERIRHQKYREANLDRVKANSKEYDEKHKDTIRIRKQKYYLDNKEHILERCKEYQKGKRSTNSNI